MTVPSSRERFPAIREALIQELGREPLLTEVARRMDLTVAAISLIYRDLEIDSKAGMNAKNAEDRAALREGLEPPEDPDAAAIRARPGANLLEWIEIRGVDYSDFAESVCSGDRYQARGSLRRYTHPGPGEAPRWPSAEVVAKWASVLEVDASVFFAE